MNIGFLGSGHITSSIIEGIFKSKLKIKKIYISPRNKLISKKLSKRFKKVIVSNNNQQVIDSSSWVFLAVTPHVGNKILKNLKFNKSKKIISLISTMNINRLKKITKNKNISRVIPLPFIGMRKGPIIICPNDNKLKNFFKHLGKVIELTSENKSKSFWATSSFMASFYNLLKKFFTCLSGGQIGMGPFLIEIGGSGIALTILTFLPINFFNLAKLIVEIKLTTF